jgi:O-antigen ligase
VNDVERLAFTCAVPGPADAPPVALVAGIPPAAGAERHEALAFSALLAFMFVLFVRPQDQLPVLQALHLADLTAAFALIALVAGRLARGARMSRTTPELLLVLALGAVMLATAPFSVWPGGAVAVFTDLYIKVILVFALIVNTVTTRARLERLIQLIVLGTGYIGIRAVVDYARGVNLIEGGRVVGAVGGLFGNPNDMALNMVAFLPLAIILALGRGQPLLRALVLLCVPAIGAAIIFTKSRGGTVGLVAMLLVLLYRLRRHRPGIAALVIAGTLGAVPLLPSSFTERMSSIFNAEADPTGSREARKQLLRESYRAFLDHPVFGLGAGQFPNYRPEDREEAWRETHNAVLQVAAELGIVGLVVFSLLIGTGFAAVARTGTLLRRPAGHRRARAPDGSRARNEPLELYATAMAASLTGWFVAAMFASVAYYWTFYVVLGLAGALRDVSAAETRGTNEGVGRAWRAEAA